MRNRTNGKRRRVVENLISFCTLARASSIMVCKIGFDFDGYSSAGVERMVLTFVLNLRRFSHGLLLLSVRFSRQRNRIRLKGMIRCNSLCHPRNHF